MWRTVYDYLGTHTVSLTGSTVRACRWGGEWFWVGGSGVSVTGEGTVEVSSVSVEKGMLEVLASELRAPELERSSSSVSPSPGSEKKPDVDKEQ